MRMSRQTKWSCSADFRLLFAFVDNSHWAQITYVYNDPPCIFCYCYCSIYFNCQSGWWKKISEANTEHRKIFRNEEAILGTENDEADS